MQCPYCQKEMIVGTIYGVEDRAVYWLPDPGRRDYHLLTRKNIEKRGGMILDDVSRFGFFAKARPDSHYCKTCRIFLTKLP